MILDKLMPLTLLGVAIFASGAFAQDTTSGKSNQTLEEVQVNLPRAVDYTGIGVWKNNRFRPSGTATFNSPTYNAYGWNSGGWSINNFATREQKEPSYCYSLYCAPNPGSMVLANPYFNTQARNDKLGYGLAQNFKPKTVCEYLPETASLDNLQDLQQKTNIVDCYKNRNSAENKANPNQYELFQKDLEVCGCLKKAGETNGAVKDILNVPLSELRQVKNGDAPDAVASEDEKFNNFEENSKLIRAQMNQNSDAMSFQASIFSAMSGKPVKGDEIDAFAAVYATNPLGKPSDDITSKANYNFVNPGKVAVTGVSIGATGTALGLQSQGDNAVVAAVGRHANGALRQMVSLVSGKAGGSSDDKSGVPKVSSEDVARAAKVNKVLNEMAQPYQANRALFEPTDLQAPKGNEPGQCVSAREFMAFKQMPSDERTIKDIKEDKGSVDQWDYKKLRAEYDNYMHFPMTERAKQKDRIIFLKSRIQFLERNPLMKNFLAADDSDLNRFFGSTPTHNQGEIRKSYEADPENGVPDLKTRKEQLIGMIKRIVPQGNCSSPACLFDQMNTPDAKKVREEMLKFFANPANATVTKTENDKANAFLLDDFFQKSEKLYSKAPKLYTRENVDNAFAKYFGLGSPKNCDAESRLDVCVRTYAGYCQYLDDQFPKITDQLITDRELADDLDETVAGFFNTDIKTNKELAEFNDSICNTARRSSLNQQDGKFQTFWQYRDSVCRSKPAGYCDSAEGMQAIRAEYLAKNPEPAVPGKGIASVYVKGFNALMRGSGVGRGMNRATLAQLQNGGGTQNRSISDILAGFNRDMGYEENIFEDSATSRLAESSKSLGSNFATAGSDKSTKVDNKIDNSSQLDDMPSMSQGYNYAAAGNASTSSTVANTDQPQKVENMTDPQRQELMDDWQKEYDQWKKSKDNDGSAVASANEAAMQARIQALEQLLAQQKKLTEDQYKLLNDAIANQKANVNTAIAQTQDNSSSTRSSNGRNRSTSAISGSTDDEEVVSRAPASVPNQIQNTAGVGGGAGSAGVGSGSSSSRRVSVGGSSDDVAREEAKLVNLRSNKDGSIVISAVNNSTGAGANAISVPVTDEQYRALQANPQSLNLSQIEKNIPKDQIAKLEKDGEIVILLRNGSNPPFEVKVEKKNNKLVYSLKDKNGKEQAPVRRVFTRQALELQLKANR